MRSMHRSGRPPPKTAAVARFVMLLPVVFAAALLFLSGAQARSPHPPPLRRIHTPSTSPLEILPRQKSSLAIRSRAPYPHPRTLRHDDSFFLTVDLPNILPHSVNLLLRPAENFFHPDAKIQYADGTSERLRQEDWRLYNGDVIDPRWKERLVWEETTGNRDARSKDAVMGWANIMVVHPGSMEVNPIFEGVFRVNGIHYNVLTRDHYNSVKTAKDVIADEVGDMIVFRKADAWHEDLPAAQESFQTCNHESLPFNSNTSHPVLSGYSNEDMLNGLFKRDDTGGMSVSTNYIDSIGSSQGCPTTQRVVYMGVALDCNYVQTYGTTTAARQQILTVFNQVSALYRSTFNISLGIVELVVQNITCPSQSVQGFEWDVSCDENLTLDQRLSLFSQWRGNRQDDNIGLWHLMSACPTDTEVGVAWLGTLCQTTSNFQSGSYVSGTGVSTATRDEWSLVSHEIGHGFGAIHDCTSGCSLSGGCCPFEAGTCDAGGRFIMNPTTSETEDQFSPCTLGNICSGLGSRLVSSSCIVEPGSRTTISLQQCGNGIVDDGEECDPGSNGDATCCDPQTCKFRENAVCDPSNSGCCTDQCQFSSAGTICRPSVHETCDMAETCSGNNAACPEDRTAEDGTSCGSNGLACASGRCTSLDLQCQNAGVSMNLTRACGQKDDTSCVVACRDPRVSNQCVVLQTPLVDGSPCGYGGHCYNQTCESGSWQSTAASWYRQNLNIAIPVTVVVGIIVLLILFFLLRCIFRACSGGGRKRRGGPLPPPPQRRSMVQRPMSAAAVPTRNSDSSTDPMLHQNQYNGYPAPPEQTHQYDYGHGGYPNGGYANGGYPQQYGAQQQPGYGAPGGGWVDERLYNGQNYGRQEAWGR